MTLIVSAFPGTGKTWFYMNNTEPLKVRDSDSSKFPKADFPANYIAYIKETMALEGEQAVDIILVSSHKVVRDALVAEGLPFLLVYPTGGLKDEYISRFVERGSSAFFIELLTLNWDAWIKELDEQKNCSKYILASGEYIKDVLL